MAQLEALNPAAEPTLHCKREWDIILSSTQSFHSYPFFMVIWAVVPDHNKANIENSFNIHDCATTTLCIGHACQTIETPKNLAGDQELILEVDLSLDVFPNFLVYVRGTIIMTGNLEATAPKTWFITIKI
eukprot:14727240-Ditylum_brightwellii.AAC.1